MLNLSFAVSKNACWGSGNPSCIPACNVRQLMPQVLRIQQMGLWCYARVDRYTITHP